MDSQTKPTSLTVIGVIIIVLGAFAALGAVSMVALQDDPNVAAALEQMPVPLETLLIINGVGAAIMVIAGAGVIMGANWGRWLYVVYSVLGIAFGLYASPSILQVIPSVVVLALFSYFLFRKRENDYFNRAA